MFIVTSRANDWTLAKFREYGADSGLYVSDRDGAGFTVRAGRGSGAGEFSYRVAALRRDTVGLRMVEVDRPGTKPAPGEDPES